MVAICASIKLPCLLTDLRRLTPSSPLLLSLPLVQYCSSDGINPSQIIMIGDGRKAIDAVKDKAFDKFLTDNGYVRSNSQSDREYTNEKELLSLKVYISEKENNEGVNLTFTPIMKQTGEYKTFNKLPFYPLELLQKDNVKLAQVEQYEQRAGSTEEERTRTTSTRPRRCHSFNIS